CDQRQGTGARRRLHARPAILHRLRRELANERPEAVRFHVGSDVHSSCPLGIRGGRKAILKSFVRGEISDLTSLIYDAREHAIGLIRDEADAIGADDVMGVKTHIHEMGNLIEFMAIGTAVKKMPELKTTSPSLPPQAIMRDRETWFSEDPYYLTVNT